MSTGESRNIYLFYDTTCDMFLSYNYNEDIATWCSANDINIHFVNDDQLTGYYSYRDGGGVPGDFLRGEDLDIIYFITNSVGWGQVAIVPAEVKNGSIININHVDAFWI